MGVTPELHGSSVLAAKEKIFEYKMLVKGSLTIGNQSFQAKALSVPAVFQSKL